MKSKLQEKIWFQFASNFHLKMKTFLIFLERMHDKIESIKGKTKLSTQGFEHDIKGKYARVTRNSKWSKDNQYDRFSVLNGIKPVTENIVTSMPNFSDITYEFILWTNFIEQMNPLVETFMEYDKTYWGDKDTYRFVSSLDSVSDASEMNQDGERFIKSTFSVITKAYLLPQETNSIVMGKMNQVQKRLSPAKVVFGLESDATDYQVGKK